MSSMAIALNPDKPFTAPSEMESGGHKCVTESRVKIISIQITRISLLLKRLIPAAVVVSCATTHKGSQNNMCLYIIQYNLRKG
jgi:hypothetical protein